MKIICIAIQQLEDIRHKVLKTLFELTNDLDLDMQAQVLILIFSICFRIKFCNLENLSCNNITYCFKYLKS